jgi:2-polyprenyl-3-methyl-5-hydroxy-6-metoxy-1,4-benzoquinol methylase
MSWDKGALWRAFSSYSGAPWSTRAFITARMLVNAPLVALGEETRAFGGRILSLGSGISIVERYLAECNPHIEFVGVDLDPSRVELIRSTQRRSPRVTVRHGDATELDAEEAESYDGVLICDVLHHLDPEAHKPVARSVARLLRPGGVCFFKDLDVRPRWKHEWNRLHDRIVAGPEPIHCITPDAAADLLTNAGLVPERVERIDRRFEPYAQYLVRARKP